VILSIVHRTRITQGRRNRKINHASGLLFNPQGKQGRTSTEVLRNNLVGLTKTPRGSRRIDRQLFDKDGNERVTPKMVTNSRKSATGTSGSKKRKHDDDSDGSYGEEDVDAIISMIEKNYLTPTKAGGESESNEENQHDLLESSTIKAELNA